MTSTLGLDQHLKPSEIIVFPNPTEGSFIVWLSDFKYKDIDITLTSLNGWNIPIVLSKAYTGEITFDISGLPKGMCFLKITNEKDVMSKKIQLK